MVQQIVRILRPRFISIAGEEMDLSDKDLKERKHKDGEDFVTIANSLGVEIAFEPGLAYSHPSNGQRRLYYK